MRLLLRDLLLSSTLFSNLKHCIWPGVMVFRKEAVNSYSLVGILDSRDMTWLKILTFSTFLQ